MSLSVLGRRVAALAVAGTGLTVVLCGAFAPEANAAPATAARTSASSSADSSWFVDPRTPAQRRAEIAVPRNPKAYAGKRRETEAVYRTRAGDLAVPMTTAFGHQLAQGQAVLLSFKTAKLPTALQAQVVRLASALDNASTVRCEGYADYADPAASTRKRSAIRAAAVCDLLAAHVPGLRTTVVSYGAAWPAVVGGKPAARALNRRVVVQMTGTRRPSGPVLKVPGAPTLTSVDGYLGTLRYAFTAPTTDGGTPVTGYQVNAGDGWEPVVLDNAPARTAAGACLAACSEGIVGILRDVPAGVDQHLRVRAVNRVGAGAPSNTVSAVAYGLPGQPSELSVVGGDGTLTTTFGAPAHDGGSPVLGYEISYDGGLSWSPVESSTDSWSVVKDGLDNGTVYDVAVRAYSLWGVGEPATASELVATIPDAPWLESQVATDGTTATLTWTSPQLDGGTDGGADITGYEITFDGGLSWDDLAYTTDSEPGIYHATLTDLTLGNLYKVAVRAVNEQGAGISSKTRQFTPAVVPDAPSAVVASADGASVTVTFDAPASDGGAEVTGYEVKVDDGDWAPVVLSSSGLGFTLSGQVPGTHTYSVRAVNRVGASLAGSSDPITVEEATPDAPTITYFGYNGVSKAWSVEFTPGADNGATVTGWQVSVDGGAWVDASDVYASGSSLYADFACADGDCGWSYSTPIRLRAVTATGSSAPSQPYAPGEV